MADGFAGVRYSYPSEGDEVLIVEGLHEGQVLEVASVKGNAFSNALRIFVHSPDGLVWYWPWNVKVLPKKAGRRDFKP